MSQRDAYVATSPRIVSDVGGLVVQLVGVVLLSSFCAVLGELFASQALLGEGLGARVVLAAQVAQEVVDHPGLPEVVS